MLRQHRPRIGQVSIEHRFVSSRQLQQSLVSLREFTQRNRRPASQRTSHHAAESFEEFSIDRQLTQTSSDLGVPGGWATQMEHPVVVDHEDDLHLGWDLDAVLPHALMRIGPQTCHELVGLGPVAEYHPKKAMGCVWEVIALVGHDS